MANQVNTQILQDGARNAVVKITGVLDTSNVSISDVITTSMFTPAPTGFRIDHLDYSISDPLEVRLLWDGTPQLDILPIAGRGRMSFWNFGGLINNATGKTGKIQIMTDGYTSGTSVFSAATGQRPTIGTGAFASTLNGTAGVPTTQNFAAGDFLRVQVAQGAAGNMSVQFIGY